jgi:Rieske Fe-S protein
MDKNKDRRSFIKKAGAFIGLGVLTPAIGTVVTSCEKDEVQIIDPPPPSTYDINLNDYPALKTVGGDATFSLDLVDEDGNVYQKLNCVAKRAGEDEFWVLDSLCRHQGCDVILPDSPDGDLVCPCHNVSFDFETGVVTDKPISDAVPDLKKIKVFEFDKANNILKLLI